MILMLTGEMVKIHDRFDFEEEINLSSFLDSSPIETSNVCDSLDKDLITKSKQDKDHIYVLHSVVIHRGGSEGGHYYSYVNPYGLGKWYRLDDTRITQVEKHDMYADAVGGTIHRTFVGEESTCAYMLQYIKKDWYGLSPSARGNVEDADESEICKPKEDQNNYQNTKFKRKSSKKEIFRKATNWLRSKL